VHNAHVPAMNLRKQLPSHVAMAWPTLCAIKRAGGSASNAEIMDAVAVDLRLTEEQRGLLCGRGSRTLLDYRLAWARTFLRTMGAIQNDAPCQWSITDRGRETTSEDVQQYAKAMLDKLVEYDKNRRS
jgi:restriction system protein